MAEILRAIPDQLSHVGTQLTQHSQSLLSLQQACHRDVDGAQQGWVGSSARALPGLLELWSAASTVHVRRVEEHSDGLRSAAAGFTELDRRNASSLR